MQETQRLRDEEQLHRATAAELEKVKGDCDRLVARENNLQDRREELGREGPVLEQHRATLIPQIAAAKLQGVAVEGHVDRQVAEWAARVAPLRVVLVAAEGKPWEATEGKCAPDSADQTADIGPADSYQIERAASNHDTTA